MMYCMWVRERSFFSIYIIVSWAFDASEQNVCNHCEKVQSIQMQRTMLSTEIPICCSNFRQKDTIRKPFVSATLPNGHGKT